MISTDTRSPLGVGAKEHLPDLHAQLRVSLMAVVRSVNALDLLVTSLDFPSPADPQSTDCEMPEDCFAGTMQMLLVGLPDLEGRIDSAAARLRAILSQVDRR